MVRCFALRKWGITDVIPFNEIDENTLEEWQGIVNDEFYQNLFATETDYFIKAKLNEYDQDLIFVRTVDKGWFSFNNDLWDGRLDVDGSFNALLYK